jgi:hypothetical protein
MFTGKQHSISQVQRLWCLNKSILVYMRTLKIIIVSYYKGISTSLVALMESILGISSHLDKFFLILLSFETRRCVKLERR